MEFKREKKASSSRSESHLSQHIKIHKAKKKKIFLALIRFPAQKDCRGRGIEMVNAKAGVRAGTL